MDLPQAKPKLDNHRYLDWTNRGN